MPSSGGGTGTPIAGGAPGTGFPSTRGRKRTYLSLEDYGRILGLSESAIYGIVRQDDPEIGCGSEYWDETDRYQMTHAIQQAESKMENRLRHRMKLTWICDEVHAFTGCEIKLRNGMVQSLGRITEEVVETDVATGVDTLAEEYDIEVTVDFDQCNELVVYYPGQTTYEIRPSNVSISGTTATITIPRSRLLKPEYLIDYADDTDRPLWEDDDYFLPVVDVYRRFPDASRAVELIWYRKNCGGCSGCGGLKYSDNPGEYTTQYAAANVTNSRLGMITFEQGTYNTTTGEWDEAIWKECGPPDRIKVNYVSGLEELCADKCPVDPDPELARAIIALAHSELPRPICSCDPIKFFYEHDARAPAPDEGPTIRTPFGQTRGQVLAWDTVASRAIGRGGFFG